MQDNLVNSQIHSAIDQAVEEIKTDSRTTGYCPPWLIAIMSESDSKIAFHQYARSVYVDVDGNRLPNHQQIIESPLGSIWIDSQKKAIIGYGPEVIEQSDVLAVVRKNNSRPKI